MTNATLVTAKAQQKAQHQKYALHVAALVQSALSKVSSRFNAHAIHVTDRARLSKTHAKNVVVLDV